LGFSQSEVPFIGLYYKHVMIINDNSSVISK
jgi:hypothetical protein